jgi:hypothetical protein
MRKMMIPPGLFLMILLAIQSCNPEFKATVEELDLAITTYDDTQNFGQLSTFYMEDTIIYIKDDEVEIQSVDNSTEQHILDQVRQNLLEIGWEEVTDTTNEDVQSDVAIMISVLEADIYYYYTYWWNWWNWYPWDWWYPVYPGYPIYPVYPSYPTYGYTVGTLLVEMVNTTDDVFLPPVEDVPIRLPVVWSGAVNGILSGSEENIQTRLTRQIEQVFLQSDYLHKGTID